MNNKGLKLLSNLGCLLSVLGPVLALLLYPRARWLFGLVFLGVAVVIVGVLSSKQPVPQAVADQAQKLLEGTSRGWDVDDYEHLNPREHRLRELWLRTMEVGGLPEEWASLDELKKRQLQDAIDAMRFLSSSE